MSKIPLSHRWFTVVVWCLCGGLFSVRQARAQEEAPSANIWIDASSRNSCKEMEGLPVTARVIAHTFPKTEWRPDIYFAMERVEREASGKVAVRYLGKELFKKEVKAGTCSDVIAALLLSLQIYVDEVKKADLPKLEEAPPRQGAGSSAAPPGWPGPDLDPFALGPEGDPFGRADPASPRVFNWRPALYVGMVRGVNLLPNSSWGGSGVEITGTIPLDEHIGFDGGTRYLTSAPLFVEGYRFRFSSTTFFVGPSRSWRVSDVATLRMNFTAVVTLIHASVSSGDSRAASPPFASAGTGLNAVLAMNPFAGFLFEVRVGGQALSLNGVYLAPSGATVWEQPLLGALGGISVGWGGEKVQQKRRFVDNAADFSFSHEGFAPSGQ